MRDLISIIIPVYGDNKLVKMLYDRLRDESSKIDADFEFIMVCDCCPKGSGKEIEKLAQIDKRVKYIDLVHNVGQHLAIKAGIDCANGNYAIVMDCDLQDNPKEIIRFYEKIKKSEADVVFGKRRARSEGIFKKLSSFIARSIYTKFDDMNNNENDRFCGNYSILKKNVIEALQKVNETYFVFTAIISNLGFRKEYIEIEQEERPLGESGYNFFKGLRLFTHSLVNNSNKPLIFAAYCAFFMFLCSMIFVIKLIADYFFVGKPLIGWTSLMCAIFFISGLLFAYLGLLGIYIGQIFRLSQNRPLYIIKKKMNL